MILNCIYLGSELLVWQNKTFEWGIFQNFIEKNEANWSIDVSII